MGNQKLSAALTCVVALLAHSVDSFSTRLPRRPRYYLHSSASNHHSEASFYDQDVDILRRQSLTCFWTLLVAAGTIPSKSAFAVVMEDKQTVFRTGQSLGADDAKARFLEARKSLLYLVDNYDEITKGGGDNVRRYLGTVGTTSAMYGITKVLKELQAEADDIVEFTENMNDFDYSLGAADTSVYSANFVEFSAAITKPEKFFNDALADIKRMLKFMDAMAEEIK